MSVTFYSNGIDSEINLSNVNAARVLETLGYDLGDLTGEDTAGAFLGRVLVALAITPVDAGVPSTVSGGGNGLTWIDCGRREGYLQERLVQLHELAETAPSGAVISWA